MAISCKFQEIALYLQRQKSKVGVEVAQQRRHFLCQHFKEIKSMQHRVG